jgi:hypothetical protein
MNRTARLKLVLMPTLLLLLPLVVTTAAGSLCVAAPSAIGSGPPDLPDVGRFLTPDGRVDLEAIRESGYAGALDLRGYRAAFDGQGSPRLIRGGTDRGALAVGDENWRTGYEPPGPDGIVNTMAVYGGSLIVGGRFPTAGGAVARNIAQWNGAAWSAMGDGLGPANGVYAFTVHEGHLYAGGDFTTSGSVTVNRIARWTGTFWTSLTIGLNGCVYALGAYQVVDRGRGLLHRRRLQRRRDRPVERHPVGRSRGRRHECPGPVPSEHLTHRHSEHQSIARRLQQLLLLGWDHPSLRDRVPVKLPTCPPRTCSPRLAILIATTTAITAGSPPRGRSHKPVTSVPDAAPARSAR